MTKTDKILEHLKKHKVLTTWEAIIRYRETRLSAIIFNLRKQGYDIRDEWKFSKDKKVKYKEYWLEDKEE